MLLQMAKNFIPFYGEVLLHCMYIYHTFIHLSVGCFHILATVNSAAINTGVHISFTVSDLFFLFPLKSGIVESCGVPIFRFLRNLHTVFQSCCMLFEFPSAL